MNDRKFGEMPDSMDASTPGSDVVGVPIVEPITKHVCSMKRVDASGQCADPLCRLHRYPPSVC